MISTHTYYAPCIHCLYTAYRLYCATVAICNRCGIARWLVTSIGTCLRSSGCRVTTEYIFQFRSRQCCADAVRIGDFEFFHFVDIIWMLTTLFLHMSQPDNGSNLAPCLCNNLTDKGNMKVTSGNSCQTIAICIVCRPISCSRLLTSLKLTYDVS